MASIEKRQTNQGIRYRARITLKGHPRLSETFTTRREALRWAERTTEALRARRFDPESESEQHTVGDLIDRFIRERLHQLADPTQNRERGAKVVLVGDPDQLKTIGAGDAFRGLIAEHGAARVDTIRRQAEAWQRAASEQVAAGQIAPALDAYREHGAIEWHQDREGARDALVMQYFEDRYLAPDQSSLILAHRNADVRRLNERIRQARCDAGELAPGVRLNGREFSPGDRVLFLRNNHAGRHVRTVEGQGKGVKNGALGTLLEAEAGRFRIRLDSGRTVELNPRLYGRLDHGCATTVHKAQGVTVDRAYVLADRSFDRNLAYVALTRHRHRLALYVDHETFASGDHLHQVLAREPRKDLARDYRAADGLPVLNPATEPLPAAPPPEPDSVEVTPHRLEQLQDALDRLGRWDELAAQAREGAQASQRATLRGQHPGPRAGAARP